ncbi:hypothetical protein CLV87_1068 [Pelagimonas phthalicica]|nr:hypothetical protein CLV87_1068 [Pelagimonas phthalicica]
MLLRCVWLHTSQWWNVFFDPDHVLHKAGALPRPERARDSPEYLDQEETETMREKKPRAKFARGHELESETVKSAQKAAGDDLSLNFAGTFKDIEDPGVAEDARDGVFQRKAVTAMDLQRIIGSGPGDACAK